MRLVVVHRQLDRCVTSGVQRRQQHKLLVPRADERDSGQEDHSGGGDQPEPGEQGERESGGLLVAARHPLRLRAKVAGTHAAGEGAARELANG